MFIDREALHLAKRATCGYNAYGRYVCYNSGWYDYGRWILLGVIVLLFFLLFFGCSCISRRRARRQQKPFYGTGWMSHGVQPAPPYTATATNTGNNYAAPTGPPPNGGYYGQENGYAPQKPAPAYAGNEGYNNNNYNNNNGGYAPPSGPPPNQQYR